jgi:cell division protein FtsB
MLAEIYFVILCYILVFQVVEFKRLSSQEKNKARVKALEAENEQLRKEIEEWKNKLIRLETENGIKQVIFQFKCFNFFSFIFLCFN